MKDEREELMDETVLRRALRLEPDEGAPRFDARTIALMARASTPPLRSIGFALSAAVLVGFAAGGIWSSIFATAPSILDTAMQAIVEVAIPLSAVLLPLFDLAQQPAVPLSVLAALGVAILYELRERRERAHADAS